MDYKKYLQELKLQKELIKDDIKTNGPTQETILILGCTEMQIALVTNIVLKTIKNDFSEIQD